jgi:hypothetical protein
MASLHFEKQWCDTKLGAERVFSPSRAGAFAVLT